MQIGRIVSSLAWSLVAVGLCGLAVYVLIAFVGDDSPICASGSARVTGCTTAGASAATVLAGLGAVAAGLAITAWRRA